MQPNDHRSISVRFGADSVMTIAVQVTTHGEESPDNRRSESVATLDAQAGTELLHRALATPALVSQLNALVPDDVPCDPPEDAAERLPRCTGGRVYQWRAALPLSCHALSRSV